MFKKLLFVFAIAISLPVNARYDIEAICRSNIQVTKDRAQWGLNLREQMQRECKPSNIKQCSAKYFAIIEDQFQQDLSRLIEMFNQGDYTPGDRAIMRGNVQWAKNAADYALGTGRSATSIANEIYTKCSSVR